MNSVKSADVSVMLTALRVGVAPRNCATSGLAHREAVTVMAATRLSTSTYGGENQLTESLKACSSL